MNMQATFPTATAVQGSAQAPAADTPLGAVMQSPELGQSQTQVADAVAAATLSSEPEDTTPGYNKFLDLSEGDTPKQDVCIVNLYADGCFDCKHLVEGAEVDYVKCHFSRGNTHCPASNIRIQFVGARVKWDKKIAKIEAMEVGIARTNAQIALSTEAQEIEDDSLRTYVLGKVFR
jgi:hypothetical protein